MADRIPGTAGPVRTVLTVVVALLFSVAFAASSLLEWASLTVLDPDYVKPALREAGVYEVLHQETIPGFLDRELLSFGLDEPEQREFVKRVVAEVAPPDALRERVEHALDQVLPYVARETGEMTIRPRLSEWALAVPDTLARLDFPTWMVDAVLAPRLRPALEAVAADPLRARVSAGDAPRVAGAIAPPRWMDAQVVGATYAVARWATGAQRTFEIRIDYTDRVDAATEAFKEILRTSRVERVLIDRAVVPMAEQGLASLEPFEGTDVDRDALADIVREVAPRGWLTGQVDGLIDALGDWLAGRTEEVEYRIATGELSRTAGDIVVALARRTLGEAATSAVEAPLRESVRRYFPAQTSWSTDDLRAGIGDSAYQQLLGMRRFVTEGFVYTHEDLRRDLSARLGLSDAEIDNVRHILGESYAYTEVDLEKAALGTRLEVALRTARGTTAWALPIHLIAFALLVALVLVAGPSPWRRALFATGTLAVAALAIWIALTPYVASVLEPRTVALLPLADPTSHPRYSDLVALARDTAAVLGTWGRNVFILALVSFVGLYVAALRTRAGARS